MRAVGYPLRKLLFSSQSATFSLAVLLSSLILTQSGSTLGFAATPPSSSRYSDISCTAADTATNSNNIMSPSSHLRSVWRILPSTSPHWVGNGFRVHPVFGDLAFTDELSPFLMFDYAAPKTFTPNPKPDQPLGVGKHPHRGFETVTIAYKGEVEHADSTGKRGVIKTGDVQWMTAGRGIVHEEFHSKEFSKKGGDFEMCQLWVNLPRKDKMTPPHYQPIKSEDIPVVSLPLNGDGKAGDETKEESSGSVRVIAGSLGGTKGAATTYSPVELWDVTLPRKDVAVDLPFPDSYNCIVFVRRGGVHVLSGPADDPNEEFVGPQAVALMKRHSGDTLRVRAAEPNTQLVIMGGEPLNEPIAARGPFVMNTWDEIAQAADDFRNGRMGK